MNKTHFVLGGDLKKSLTEGYTLDFKQLFKDAFVITRKHFLPLIVACLVTVAIVALLYTLSFEALSSLSDTNQTIVNFIFSSFIVTPLVTGLQMMGIHHAIGIKTRSMDLFNFFNIILKLALGSVIINIIVYVSSVLLSQLLGDIGLQLSIIVMLYLNMAFCMVYPLIAEKKIAPQLAIKLSFKLINKNLRQFTFLFMTLGLLGFIAILPSGIGLFFFIPFYFNIMGIVYRQMCGVGVVATEVTENTDQNDSSTEQNSNNDDSKNNTDFEA
ncbi:hypothetical protein CW745_02265 [Psychromonas sp. psych-6C06]|uniref:hypothetical protein n=1 Tax=Psychromonas sp. psych-6C06 TaxID=2058089 RepID=UPI000C32D9B8|nr:hypothetical protein [Psychromonas sp. psych-6C06]PKF63690.1 hypothetical protein CW745_02265 [Psychromonas sp. psych-6C06]